MQVNLRLTNQCNLRCIHCYYCSPFVEKPNLAILRKARRDGGQLPDKSELKKLQKISADPERLLSVIEDLLERGVRRWQLGGSGEPFFMRM